ncbi:MAG: rhomboid family intramembrane serine protease, partial [Halobacteriota archaeon]
MTAVPEWLPLYQLGIVCAFLLAAVTVWSLDRPGGRWGARLRERFVLGLPWGTLTTAAFVLAMYLFVQDGLTHWYRPVS